MKYIFLAGLLWGTIGVFVKTLAALGASPSLTSLMRMSFAFVVMFALTLPKHGRRIILHDPKTLTLCILLGLVSNGIFNLCYTTSIRQNGMAIASILLYTAPLFTAIASRIAFHEHFTPLKVCALLVNILGCVLTVTGGKLDSGSINLLGLAAGLGSGFCYGMAAIFGRAAGERTDPLIMSVYSYLSAVVFLLIFTRPDITPMVSNVKIAGVGFLYGLIPTALAYLVYYIGLGRVADTSRVPVIASIEPVSAVLIGMLVYGEEIGTANFIGVAVVLISIIIMARAK